VKGAGHIEGRKNVERIDGEKDAFREKAREKRD
jgi:hypothetical protein